MWNAGLPAFGRTLEVWKHIGGDPPAILVQVLIGSDRPERGFFLPFFKRNGPGEPPPPPQGNGGDDGLFCLFCPVFPGPSLRFSDLGPRTEDPLGPPLVAYVQNA